eukprot:Em0008g445a
MYEKYQPCPHDFRIRPFPVYPPYPAVSPPYPAVYLPYPAVYPPYPGYGGDTAGYGGYIAGYGGYTAGYGGDTAGYGGYIAGYGGYTAGYGGYTAGYGGDTAGYTAGYGGDTAGYGGYTAGYGGDTAGYGGDTAGYGGYTAGYGGYTAGYGGYTAGYGGYTAGYGGYTAGYGGDTAGYGGDTAGYGGYTAGYGGYTAGYGGHTAGYGGYTAGYGGDTAGYGGYIAGYGGYTAGYGGYTAGYGGYTAGYGGYTAGVWRVLYPPYPAVCPPYPAVYPPYPAVYPPYPAVYPPYPAVYPPYPAMYPPYPAVYPPYPAMYPPYPAVSPPYPAVYPPYPAVCPPYPAVYPPYPAVYPPYPAVSPPYPAVSPPYPAVYPPYPAVYPPYPAVYPPYPAVYPPYPAVYPPYPAVSPPYPAVSPPYPAVYPPYPAVSPPYPAVYPAVSPPYPAVYPPYPAVYPPYPAVYPPYPAVYPPYPAMYPPYPAVYQRYGQTALHISSKNGHTDTVVALLERGADINARDKMHHTPLDLARQHGHGTVVEVLERKAMKEAELWAASRDGDTNRVLSLLDTCKGISVNTRDKLVTSSSQHVLHHQTGEHTPALSSIVITPLWSHALGKHAVSLLSRFNKGALISKLDLQAAFPMVPVLASKWKLLRMHCNTYKARVMYLATWPNARLIAIILSTKLAMNLALSIGCSMAASNFPRKTSIFLSDTEISPNSRSKMMHSLHQHTSCSHDHMLNLQRILYSDPTWASLNIPSGYGQCHQPKRRTHWKLGSGQSTAPILGPHKWDLGFKHRLTDVPCHILSSTSFSLPPFLKPPPLRHLSLSLPPSRHSPSFASVGIITLLDDCLLRMIGQLYQLLSVGEEGHTDGQTALHISSKNGHTDTVVALLERGANIYARDKDGQTALHISSKNGHTDTVVALLERGADINDRDEMHRTPLDLARKHGHGKVIEVLESKAMKEAKLWAASRDGDTNRVLSLLDTCKGISVNTRDELRASLEQTQQHLPTNTNESDPTSRPTLESCGTFNKHLQPMSRAPPPDWSPHPAQPSIVVTPLLGAGLQSHIATTPACSYSQASGKQHHHHLLIPTSRLRLLAQEAVQATIVIKNISTDTFTFISTPYFPWIQGDPSFSVPQDHSFDNIISREVHYSTIHHAVALIGRFNKGALMAKLDLQAAFPWFQSWPPSGSSWECTGMTTTMLTPAFLRPIGPNHFDNFASALHWVLEHMVTLLHYLAWTTFSFNSNAYKARVMYMYLATWPNARLIAIILSTKLAINLALSIGCSMAASNFPHKTSIFLSGTEISPNSRSKDGQTALNISSKNGHTDTVVALLERGANIYARDKDGQTALHISSKNGHTDTVVALLERGADINARDKMHDTPLDLARQHGHGTVVEVLKSKAMKEAELWAASRDGDTNRVLSLLDTCKGISVNTHDKLRASLEQTQQHLPTNTNESDPTSRPILESCGTFNKHLQPMSRALPPDWSPHPAQPSIVVTPLLGAGLQSHIATTPACSYSQASGKQHHHHLLIPTSRLRLLAQEAVQATIVIKNISTDTFTFISTPYFPWIQVQQRSPHGQTGSAGSLPMVPVLASKWELLRMHCNAYKARVMYMYLATWPNARLIAIILSTKLAINLALSIGCSMAASNFPRKTSIFLSGTEISPNSRSKDGQTALHISSKNGHTDTMVALLERGADIYARDKDGQTALHISSKNGHTDTVVALLERGADINARDKDGQTALHMSSKNGPTDTVVALLERGADINAWDKMYHTPLDLARQHGHGTVVEVLESKAMKEAELWAASRDGDTNRVLSLLDTCKGINVNTRDKYGQTALHISSKNGHTDTVVALLERRADINARDKMHRTPLDLARQHGHGTVVEVLKSKAMKEAELWAASRDGDTNRVLSLLDTCKGINVNTRDEVLVGSTTALQCWYGSNKHLQPMSRAPPPDWSPHPAQPSIMVTPLLGAGLQSHIATHPCLLIQPSIRQAAPLPPAYSDQQTPTTDTGAINSNAHKARVMYLATWPNARLIAIILSTKLAINLAQSIGCSMAASNFPRKTSIFLSDTEISPNSRSKQFCYCICHTFHFYLSRMLIRLYVGEKWRVILHFSLPQDHSFDNIISREEFTLHYSTIHHAVALIGRFNKGARMTKLDLQAAFPMVPVLASKWELLGMHWHDNYYVDTCLPFSLLAPSILTTLPVPSTGDYFLIYCTRVEDTVVALLERGADINTRDKDGQTALHISSKNGHTDTVVALLERGADINARDQMHRTPLDLARQHGHGTVVEVLESIGMKKAELWAASRDGDTNRVLSLLDTRKGINVNTRDEASDFQHSFDPLDSLYWQGVLIYSQDRVD